MTRPLPIALVALLAACPPPSSGGGDGGADAGLPRTEAPRLSPASGAYPAGTEVSLKAADPDADIFYTLDGTTPDAAATRYQARLRLTSPVTVRAIAQAPGKEPSAVVSGQYTLERAVIVHFKKPASWKAAYVHYWGTEPSKLSSTWPGVPMTPDADGWYSYTFKDQTSVNVVFNAGGAPQSPDIHWSRAEGWFDDWDRWETNPDLVLKHCAFPGGRLKALVMSFDDGNLQDKRLIELFNRYGLKGTFHLNSGLFGRSDKVPAAEVKDVYRGHEVSVHSVTHPNLEQMDRNQLRAEVLEDKNALEALVGYPVRGMAYPFGSYNQTLLDAMPEWGLVYGRVVPSTYDFRLPGDLRTWRGSTHHGGAGPLAEQLVQLNPSQMALLYVWGHSWELDGNQPNNSWADMEKLCQKLGGRGDIWYATAIEVADYLTALEALEFSGGTVRNPTSRSVWIKKGAQAVELKPYGGLEL